MFFLRSIRRRLVTGFTISLALLLAMAAAAILGLVWHQQAVEEFTNVVHHSPDKAKLREVVFDTLIALKSNIDRPEAVQKIRDDYRNKVNTAIREARQFRERVERTVIASEVSRQGGGRAILSTRLTTIDEELKKLSGLELQIEFRHDIMPAQLISGVRMTASGHVLLISEVLGRLPAYRAEQTATGLLKEQQQSAQLLNFVLVLTALAVACYAITVCCAFQWVSFPLRTIAKGTSRISNGDTNYRLGSVSRWNDEFADLAANFNRMANRFQESEDNLNAKVEERSRQLVRSERLAGVGFLSAGVAHEINTPLSSITMAAESLQSRLYEQLDPDHEDTAEALSRLEMIQRESKRCGQITRRLLDFSRNDKQHILAHDLTMVVQEVLDMVRPMDRYRDRNVIFDQSDPLILDINASQIKQVVLNLVANGLQATEAGGTVQIRLEGQTDWVVIEITDDGQGMEPENIGNLFEPFFSTKETGQGTGLGLSITHRIIEEHHGTIDPFSAGPGKGSRFSIRLPRRQPQQKAA
ncbi:MAG: HAMP domain-containing histidine kinase [Fuerstiella sp.]|nr:HAMP domain-containing histidine kinase [Fuerstiella sp.]MCP4857559.1 HAMP domain-containing histidine kinase [Fuerstiella sp.]